MPCLAPYWICFLDPVILRRTCSPMVPEKLLMWAWAASTTPNFSSSVNSFTSKINLVCQSAGGDRAPDTPELNVGGEPLRLFDVFRGPHFTLLRPFGHDGQLSGRELRGVKRVDVSKAQKQDSGAQVYVDAFGHIAAAYGLGKGEYMLVRPDGYVG